MVEKKEDKSVIAYVLGIVSIVFAFFQLLTEEVKKTQDKQEEAKKAKAKTAKKKWLKR